MTFPLAGASIDMDFAGGNYFGVAGPTSALSITRASNGYAKTKAGLLTSFSSNVLRITDLGLLIEDARTNVALQSQTLDNATYWKTTSVTVTADQIAAPDGTITADKVAASTTTTFGNVLGLAIQNYFPGTATYAISGYFKAGSGASWIVIQSTDGGANQFGNWFNIATGQIGVAAGGAGSGVLEGTSVEALANGWYRCTIIGHFSSAPLQATVLIYACCPADGSLNIVSGDFQYWWGIQPELGAFASSYIPTTTTSATRALDLVPIVTGSLNSILVTQPNTVLVDVTAIGPVGHFSAIIAASNGLQPGIFSYSAHTQSSGIDASNNSLIANFGNSLSYELGVKIGLAQASGARSIVGGGGSVVTDALGSAFGANSVLGTSGYDLNFTSIIFRRFTVWNSKLSDATLQQFTIPDPPFMPQAVIQM